MKKIIKLSSIALLATMPLVVSAQTMSPPSLMDTLEFNEKVFKVQNRLNLKEKIQLKRQQEAQKNQPLSYKSIKKGKAIEVFKYDVANIWVQKINLTQGAKIDSIINQYGYDAQLSEPLFAKKSLKDQVKSLKNTPFSIINGQFFNPRRSATTLSFGLKTRSAVMSAGADNGTMPKNILTIVGNTAKILPYSWKNLSNPDATFAMVNLTVKTPRYPGSNIGRTYICIPHPDSDISGSTLLVWTALDASELAIESELYRWGCTPDSVAKLDSSGSTRLYVGGKYYFGHAHRGRPDFRTIPHSIAIYDGN